MDDVIKIKDQFYILADSAIAAEQVRVLKHADTFGIFDRRGNIRPLGFEEHGVYYQGTRFLSQSDFTINGKAPLLLSSNVKEDNDFLVVDLTNPDIKDAKGSFIERGTVHFVRTIFLWDGRYFERMRVSNFGQQTVTFLLSMKYGADYRDIFEVRGIPRKKRGTLLEAQTGADALILGYQGLDNKTPAQAANIELNLGSDKYLDLIKQAGNKPNFVNNLGKRIKKVSIVNDGDCIRIIPTGWIDKHIWREINDILKLHQFSWLSNRKDSCWMNILS